MQINSHGGTCCGIAHIYGFGPVNNTAEIYDYSKEQLRKSAVWNYLYNQALNKDDREELTRLCKEENRETFPKVIKNERNLTYQQQFEKTHASVSNGLLREVVLTDKQISANPEWPKILKDKGYRLVTRFVNPNSENTCNVFHQSGNFVDDTPKWWSDLDEERKN